MFQRQFEWSMLVLRVVLGIIFLAHGTQKFSGIEGVIKFFASVGLPAAMAYVTATIETVGGAFLLLGFFTRIAALGICGVMLGAIFTVKIGSGLIGGYEFELSLLVMAVALVLSGSRLFALGNLFPGLKSDFGKRN